MSITPAPPNRPSSLYTDGMMELSKTPGRRKQSFPTKTQPVEDRGGKNQQHQHQHQQQGETSPVRGDGEADNDYVPDFTGNSPWCNLQIVKAKVSVHS